MHKYELIIYWSNDDSAFFIEAPELPGCVAHGQDIANTIKARFNFRP